VDWRALGLGAALVSVTTLARTEEWDSATAPNVPVEQTTVSGAIGTVIVQDKADKTAAESAKLRLREIPGGASLVTAEAFESGRVGSVADILAFQPGVFAQSAQGSDGLKISIRGSGINRGTGFFRSGTQFYFDGLPLTGAGGTPYELFEPLGLEYTEVLRGGNAFDYGSVALGGAINYVTKTGKDTPGFGVRTEAGSFDYYKGQISSGIVSGPFDYYVSLTGSDRSGFQAHSNAETWGVASNFGYQVSPSVETRFYLRHRRTDNEVPGYVRQKDIDEDPTRANPSNLQQNTRRLQSGSTWFANKTTFQLGEGQTLVAGLVYHDYPIVINPDPARGTVGIPANGADSPQPLLPNARLATQSEWWFSDIAASLTYSRTDSPLGHRSNSSVAFSTTYHPSAGVRIYENNPNITTGANAFGSLVKKANYDGSSDTVFRVGNDTEVVNDLWLTTGAALVSIRRASEFEYVNPAVTLPANYQQEFSRRTNHVVPRAGVRFTFNSDWVAFANVTRSVEPPNSWSPSSGSGVVTSLNTVNNLGNGFIIADLKDQTATSYEVGVRGAQSIFQGSVSLYHTDVKNELLNVQIAPGPPPVTRELNGSDTEKEGIEAGLDTVLWHNGGEVDPFAAKTRLLLRQAYTLNSFHYKHDSMYGANELPGIPREFYQAEALFEHVSGFYASLDFQHASSTYVDYANTFRVKPYSIYNVKLGYSPPDTRWEAYLEGRNLADKGYTASVSPVFDTRVDPTAPLSSVAGQPNDLYLLSPGDGFGVFAGVSIRF